MARKLKKKDVEQDLLDTLFSVEYEWKQVRAILDQSVEPSMGGRYSEAVAQAKYLFLLREARRLNLSAIRFTIR